MTEHNVNVHFLTISQNVSGQRIDNFLHVYLKKVPRSLIYRIIRTGKVRVNKKRIKFQYKLRIGDVLKIPAIKYVKVNQLPIYRLKRIICFESMLIYEDDDLLVLNKPSGIAVHGGSGLSCNIIDELRVWYSKTQFLELVHRLDRNTSGILLIAKNRTFLTFLHEQLRLQKIKKEYLALVYGSWDFRITDISAPLIKRNIGRHTKNSNIVCIDLKYGKFSKTFFQIKENFNNFATLLIIKPITGRTHQIRVHTQYASHPIIGDNIYGNNQINMKFKKLGLNRLFLHASRLRFIHPSTKKIFNVYAPIDQSFNDGLFYLRSYNVDHNFE